MKDYDEYINELLPKLQKKGILILDKVSSDERYHLISAVKRSSNVKYFIIKSDKRVVLRYIPKCDEVINWSESMKKADDAYNIRDYDTCIKIYTTLSGLGRAKANIYARLGLCYYYIGKMRLAIDYLTVATELSKQNNDSFDFTDMINHLQMKNSGDCAKPVVRIDISEFNGDEVNDTIDNIEDIASDLCSGMSLNDICKERGLNNEQKNIILITLAKEHYIQGNDEIGDQYLKLVEREKDKSKKVKKLLQELIKNRKLYQNKGVEGHKCLMLSLNSKI